MSVVKRNLIDSWPQLKDDLGTFLSDTERSYVAEMRAYLRDELKVTTEIVKCNYRPI